MKHILQALIILFIVIMIATSNPARAGFSIWPGLVEKPPAEYSSGSFTARTQFYDNFEDVDAMCKLRNGPLPFRATYLGCYIPYEDLIIAPSQNGDLVRSAVLIHEQAHARGWRHIIPKE